MMNDTFQSMLQQTALAGHWSIERDLKVSFAEFIQLRYVRNRWGVCIEQPHNSNLVSPLWYVLFQFLEQRDRCGCILRPDAPKHLIDVTKKSSHVFQRVISTNIH